MRISEVAKKAVRLLTLERTFTIAAFGIASWQLLVPPVLGLADNGDFARLMVHFDLVHASPDRAAHYFGYLDRYYAVNRAEAKRFSPSGVISSELIFSGVAFAISRIGGGGFDLVYLGAVHIAAFAACAYFLLVSTKPFAGRMRTTGVVLGSAVFTDIAYIAYFNSFYAESATFLFMIVVIASAYMAMAAERGRMAWLVTYFGAIAALLLAKYQNVILLPAFLIFGGLLVKRWGQIRYFHAYLVFALAATYGGYLYFISSPEAVDDAVLYNSVFNGVLLGSPTPSDDLSQLGLDRGLAKYAGSTAFQRDSLRFDPVFLRKFRDTVTMGSLFSFYFDHPGRLMGALNRTVGLAFQTRPALGNYEKSAGYPPLTLSRSWAMWSSIRSVLLPRDLWFVTLIGILYLILLGRKWLRARDRLEHLQLEWSALIALMALGQLIVITISDGVSDLIKHSFLFNVLFDYMLVVLMAHVLNVVLSVSKREEALA